MALQPTHRPRLLALISFLICVFGALPFAPRVASAGAPPAVKRIAASLRRQAYEVAKRFAPKRLDTPPAWAQREDRPLATFAVIADPHYDDSGKIVWSKTIRERLLVGIEFLNTTVKPEALLLLGDIVANEHDPQQLRHVKKLLDENLRCPYLPIHGNHDGPGFEAVFGPSNYTRRIAGIRFVTIGLHYWEWDSGLATYERLPWLAETLGAHRAEPILVLAHNPPCLPTFLNSTAVVSLLDAQPHVLAVFAGHMHMDYEIAHPKPHFGFPMFARPPHALKLLRVHPDRILITTHERHGPGYRQAPIYQKIDVPAALRLRRNDEGTR